mmetsp:Transcript_15974/g.36280  ORF Transcript_15974/g.36280 Transcript_15974/m.36280 type:complete len:242 (-) Transcript_15974:202-927(-)
MSLTGFGYHGNSAPSGSPPTAARPLALIVAPVAPSTSTKVGMPSTSYSVESAALRLSPGGIASHGIVAKYSWNCPMSRSEETKMISSCLPAACSFLYVSTSCGVNALHGGHQCAEKYRPITFPSPRSVESSTESPSPCMNSSPRASHTVGGFHGKLAPSVSSMTAERPSLVMTSPVSPSRMIRLGMPETLYFLLSDAFSFRSSKGTASQGCSAKYSLKALSSRSDDTKTISKLLPAPTRPL